MTRGAARSVPLDGPVLHDAERASDPRIVPGCASLGVAFSGGVDSSTLLALAARALGRDGFVAILGVSASLAAEGNAPPRMPSRHSSACTWC